MRTMKVSKEQAKKNIISVLNRLDCKDQSLEKIGLYDYVSQRSFGIGRKVASSNTIMILESLRIDLIDCFTMTEIFEEIFQNEELKQKIQKYEGEQS